jgi:ribosomal protein S18 acetylase RimI-like enzyme
VTASNETARRLYDGLGFRQVARYRYLAREV